MINCVFLSVILCLFVVNTYRMNAAHRELAAVIEESAINGSSADVIEAVATKTSEILSQLRSLGGDSGLSEEIL